MNEHTTASWTTFRQTTGKLGPTSTLRIIYYCTKLVPLLEHIINVLMYYNTADSKKSQNSQITEQTSSSLIFLSI